MALHGEGSSGPLARPPLALVVRDPTPEEATGRIDWSRWYLTDEADMGQGCEQSNIIAVLRSSLEQLARERGWSRVLVGSDNFFAWVEGEPLVRVSPDVYVLDDPPEPLPASFQTWLAGHRAPRFAVEIVSDDWTKDYEDNPPKYAQLGVRELVIHDPGAPRGRGAARGRVPLQVYRRGADGALVRVYRGAGPARSEALGAWLVATTEGAEGRLRIARDERGMELVPTADEARDAAERARDAAEAALVERDKELAALRAELAKAKRRSKG